MRLLNVVLASSEFQLMPLWDAYFVARPFIVYAGKEEQHMLVITVGALDLELLI